METIPSYSPAFGALRFLGCQLMCFFNSVQDAHVEECLTRLPSYPRVYLAAYRQALFP